jgi:selenocysteine lyase/cysteine desulfurase
MPSLLTQLQKAREDDIAKSKEEKKRNKKKKKKRKEEAAPNVEEEEEEEEEAVAADEEEEEEEEDDDDDDDDDEEEEDDDDDEGEGGETNHNKAEIIVEVQEEEEEEEEEEDSTKNQNRNQQHRQPAESKKKKKENSEGHKSNKPSISSTASASRRDRRSGKIHNAHREFSRAMATMMMLGQATAKVYTDHESIPGREASRARFDAMCPRFAAETAPMDAVRAAEYSHLRESGRVCLDYCGLGLFSYRQQIEEWESASFAHSKIPVSLAWGAIYGGAQSGAMERVIRERIMSYLKIDKAEYSAVFTASRGASFRLLADSYPFESCDRLVTMYDHESESVGMMAKRAESRGARPSSAAFKWPSLRVDSAALKKMLLSRSRGIFRNLPAKGLFVFPAQSRISGAKYSYQWMSFARRHKWHVLLDASALGPKDMDSLALSLFSPDFIVASFYKVFALDPSGFGCLFIKNSAIPLIQDGSTLPSSSSSSSGIVQLIPVPNPWPPYTSSDDGDGDGDADGDADGGDADADGDGDPHVHNSHGGGGKQPRGEEGPGASTMESIDFSSDVPSFSGPMLGARRRSASSASKRSQRLPHVESVAEEDDHGEDDNGVYDEEEEEEENDGSYECGSDGEEAIGQASFSEEPFSGPFSGSFSDSFSGPFSGSFSGNSVAYDGGGGAYQIPGGSFRQELHGAGGIGQYDANHTDIRGADESAGIQGRDEDGSKSAENLGSSRAQQQNKGSAIRRETEGEFRLLGRRNGDSVLGTSLSPILQGSEDMEYGGFEATDFRSTDDYSAAVRVEEEVYTRAEMGSSYGGDRYYYCDEQGRIIDHGSEEEDGDRCEEPEVICRSLDHADMLGLSGATLRLRYLTNWCVRSLLQLRHPGIGNNLALVRVFGPHVRFERGASIAFNLYDCHGKMLRPGLVQALADKHCISLSIGFLRNIKFADPKAPDIQHLLGDSGANLLPGKKKGKQKANKKALRIEVLTASLSILSDFEDVYRLWAFAARFLDADFVSKELSSSAHHEQQLLVGQEEGAHANSKV